MELLRTAKAALHEGLIDQSDYDSVKTSFLRAQQIKAGLDAGFIPEAEYSHVKHAFLESLNIGLPASGGRSARSDAAGEFLILPAIPVGVATPHQQGALHGQQGWHLCRTRCARHSAHRTCSVCQAPAESAGAASLKERCNKFRASHIASQGQHF